MPSSGSWGLGGRHFGGFSAKGSGAVGSRLGMGRGARDRERDPDSESGDP